MLERPIPFNAPMVCAIQADLKTLTRRIVKWRKTAPGLNLGFSGLSVEETPTGWALCSPSRTSMEWRSAPTPCPYGKPGDRLWVREAHSIGPGPHVALQPWEHAGALAFPHVTYKADGAIERRQARWQGTFGKFRPPMFMHRWASRILLEVTDVRVERLQAISEADAQAEGIRPHVRGGWHWLKHDSGNPDDWNQFGYKTAALAFRALWEDINGEGSWAANPMVWRVAFKRVATQ